MGIIKHFFEKVKGKRKKTPERSGVFLRLAVIVAEIVIIRAHRADMLQISLRGGQDLTGLISLSGADKTQLLHTVDESCCLAKSDRELSLEKSGRN